MARIPQVLTHHAALADAGDGASNPILPTGDELSWAVLVALTIVFVVAWVAARFFIIGDRRPGALNSTLIAAVAGIVTAALYMIQRVVF